MALARQRQFSVNDSLPINQFPMRDERMDLFAVRHPYDHVKGAITVDNPEFAFKSCVRNYLLHLRFNQHAHKHRLSCFKKGNECRALFPMGLQYTWDIDWNDNNEIDWDMVDGSSTRACAFTVLPKRIFGDQYMNTHNPIISDLFACNNNVQIGDMAHAFYNTLYTIKNTQGEDAQRWVHVSTNFSRGIIREATRRQQEQEASGTEDTGEEPDFLRGLCRLMSGVRSHMSSTTISATMAHLLSTRGGSRFHLSHDTHGLPISQLEALEAGEDITYYYRRSKAPDSDTIEPWPESFADNYLLRPDALEDCCTYCMVMNYAVVQAGSKTSMESGSIRSQKYKGRELHFQEEHPSRRRSHVRELKHIQVPVIYTKQAFPEISQLEIDSSTPSTNAVMQREYYAKLALLLFYPFRDFSELRHKDGSFWSKYLWAKDTGKLWSYDPKNYKLCAAASDRALTVLENIEMETGKEELYVEETGMDIE
jgi:hypothetical protein